MSVNDYLEHYLRVKSPFIHAVPREVPGGVSLSASLSTLCSLLLIDSSARTHAYRSHTRLELSVQLSVIATVGIGNHTNFGIGASMQDLASIFAVDATASHQYRTCCCVQPRS